MASDEKPLVTAILRITFEPLVKSLAVGAELLEPAKAPVDSGRLVLEVVSRSRVEKKLLVPLGLRIPARFWLARRMSTICNRGIEDVDKRV